MYQAYDEMANCLGRVETPRRAAAQPAYESDQIGQFRSFGVKCSGFVDNVANVAALLQSLPHLARCWWRGFMPLGAPRQGFIGAVRETQGADAICLCLKGMRMDFA